MAIIKCKMCGGDLEIIEGASVAECEYCGSVQTLPKANDENLQNLYNRANTLRIKSEFDKAEKLYEKIIQADDTQAEAYWGLILCKYGIEYVDDPATFKKIPTCHRASYDSIVADDDYKSALANADSSQKAIYEAQAKEIDRIQKDILDLAQKEETYDVFICYKETDASGQRTQDSVIANDIYYQLKQEGFKVFYAAITLEGKLGREYEPIIFAALNSAKVMLSIGTKPEYFNAVWVKNEWSRFLKIVQKDRSKLLIPCYKNMDAYELPEEFAHLQAQDMGKIGFINDVVRGIKKVIKKDEQKTTVVKETVVSTSPASNTAPLLKRAFMFLEDGEWDRADEFCEQVLNIDPECAQAYLGKLMVELKVKTQDALQNCAIPFNLSNNYQKALRFADAKLKAKLEGYIEHICTRNEKNRLEGLYTSAVGQMALARTESDYKKAAEILKSISAYKDASDLAEQCVEKAEIARKDAIYAEAKKKLLLVPDTSDYKLAMRKFQQIPGWKDADQQVELCMKKIEEIKAKEEADRLERERKAEIARKAAEERAKRIKKAAIIVVSAAVAVSVLFILMTQVIIPETKYSNAVALMNEGKYSEAISAFEAMDGYKDSANKIAECNTAILDGKYNEAMALMDAGNIIEAYKALISLNGYKDSTDKASSVFDKVAEELLKVAKVGDYVLWGAYEQDNNTSNGKEVIEWLVLEIKDGKALIISKYALDCKPYHTKLVESTWETCSLRKWLNSDFINTAFSNAEKGRISTVTVSADKNPEYNGVQSGNATQDKVFLLSITEATRYFGSDSARQCKPTAYAVVNGAHERGGNTWWWLRTPGKSSDYATGIGVSGIFSYSGQNLSVKDSAVRPALWIDLSKIS